MEKGRVIFAAISSDLQKAPLQRGITTKDEAKERPACGFCFIHSRPLDQHSVKTRTILGFTIRIRNTPISLETSAKFKPQPLTKIVVVTPLFCNINIPDFC